MKLITKAIDCQLRANHNANHYPMDHRLAGWNKEVTTDHKPPLKLFTPWGACTWLISERDPDNPDILFGLCDLGMQSPEMGSVSLAELEAVRGFAGLKIERDRWFQPTMTLTEYADEARAAGRISA